jgi:hypothetical protein
MSNHQGQLNSKVDFAQGKMDKLFVEELYAD